MNPTTFVPHLFVGIGETHAFFTLRETYLATVPGPGADGNSIVNGVYQGSYEVRSFHHQNLSQDPAEAFAKAEAIAADLGLKLRSTLDDLRTEMREIRRAGAEELARREAARIEREEYWERERAASKLEKFHNAAQGIVTFGPHRGQPFAEVPRGYLTWLADKREEFDAGSILRATADAVIRLASDMLLPRPKADLYVGTVGKREVFEVEVIRVSHFDVPAFSGYGGMNRIWIVTMVTPAGACVVSKSSAFRAEEGEKLKIKATVKEHGEYKDQAQTYVQRIAILEEVVA